MMIDEKGMNMDIYIKGADMPTNCTGCRYRPLVGCNPYQDNGLSPSDHRHRTCPLTEVAEPIGDLISREDAIKTIVVAALDDRDELEAIKALPSAEAVQGWIPCSERLPKRDELVLVTYKTTDRIHLCRYLDDGSENPWWSYIDDCCAWNNVVLAWMPLPEPYKGGEDE